MLTQLDDEDQAVAELRAVVAEVRPVVEAWHAGVPMDELTHDDLAHKLEQHGRRIERAEKGVPFDEVSINVCFAVKSRRSNDGFLSDGSFQAGIRATELRPYRDKGTALATGVSEERFEILKWSYLPADDETGWDSATDVIDRAVANVHPAVPVGNPQAAIVSLDYITKTCPTTASTVPVPWSLITGNITVDGTAAWDGLQAADLYAGMLNAAITPDRFGNNSPDYFQTVAHQLRRGANGKVLDYGIKILGDKTIVTGQDWWPSVES